MRLTFWITRSPVRTRRIFINFNSVQAFSFSLQRRQQLLKFRWSTQPKLLLPLSRHTTIHGIDLEEEEWLYSELMKECIQMARQVKPNTVSSYSEGLPIYVGCITSHWLSFTTPSSLCSPRTFQSSKSANGLWIHFHLEISFLRRNMPHSAPFAHILFRDSSVDNTNRRNNTSSDSTPPLFGQGVKIDGSVVVEDRTNPQQDVMHGRAVCAFVHL
jgi:hypothetical protein